MTTMQGQIALPGLGVILPCILIVTLDVPAAAGVERVGNETRIRLRLSGNESGPQARERSARRKLPCSDTHGFA